MKTRFALLLGALLISTPEASAADLACPALAPQEWAVFEAVPAPNGLTDGQIRRGFGTDWFTEPLIFLDEEDIAVKGFRRTLTGADAEFSRRASDVARQLRETSGMCVVLTCHDNTCEVMAAYPSR